MLRFLYLLSFIFLFHTFNFAQQNVQERLIRAVYVDLKFAIMNNDDVKAVTFVDSNTINYLEHILDLTLALDTISYDTIDYNDRILVYTLYDGLPEDYLKELDGKSLFKYMVRNEMLSYETFSKTYIGNVLLDGDKAGGQLIYPNNESPFYLSFYKEDNVWKLDYRSMIPLSATSAKKSCLQREEMMKKKGLK